MKLQQPHRPPAFWTMRQGGIFGGSWRLLLILGFLFIGTAIQAQITDEDSAYYDEDQRIPGDTIVQDTTVKRKKVKEKTDWLDLMAQMNGYSLRHPAEFKIEEVMYPDFLDRAGGFHNSLGQWGKPYLRYRYGVDASNFNEGIYISPITGAENVYFLDPQHGMRYYDTRTPYVNAYYAQGRADAAQLRVDVAQNIHPLLNASILYYRRQANGVYNNFVTDHNTLGATSNFHTLNERYQVYGHFLLQKHDDQLNGGVIPLQPDLALFEKGSQPVALADANLRRLSRAGAFRQFYRITKDTTTALSDSVAATHHLQLYNGFVTEYLINQFSDAGLDTFVNQNYYPVYPTYSGDSAFFFEKMEYRRKQVDVGATYRLHTRNFNTRQRVELAQEVGELKKEFYVTDAIMDIRRLSVLWKGHVRYDPNFREIEANWTYRQTFSNVFNPESYAELDVAYRFPKWVMDYSHRVPGPPLKPEDSATIVKTHRPIGLVMRTVSYGRNPTLQQAFGTGFPGNNIAVISNLSNRRINHFSLGFELRGKDRWTATGESRGNSLRLSAFTTRHAGMIYFTPRGWDRVGLKESVVYSGAELKVRLHWKKLFVETETVLQSFAGSNRLLDTLFQLSQPTFYSKTSLFYENKDLRIAGMVKTGIDYWYFNAYAPPYFDPASQAFYRQDDFTQFGYPRMDVFFATQIKRAFVYAKMINVLENLPQLGYFTTMGYPMQVRQLMVGLNWTFFD
jgi:hypothetical protein